MLTMVAAADSASTVRKKYSVFIYSEVEPHAMYAIYKQTCTLCVVQYYLGPNTLKHGSTAKYSLEEYFAAPANTLQGFSQSK